MLRKEGEDISMKQEQAVIIVCGQASQQVFT